MAWATASPRPELAPDSHGVAPDPVERAATEADAELVRSVRRRLVLWSGASTLLVLVALGTALYVTAARNLAATGVAQLEGRADQIQAFIQGQPREPEGGPTEFIFGGGGTFAIVVAPDDRIVGGPRQIQLPGGLPDGRALTAARSSGRDLRLGNVAGVPVRVLTVMAQHRTGRYAVQVVQDRSTEARTLDALLVVLLLGGLIVVVVAFGFCTLYARRALVPIRESLAAQRAALRRQREFAADASHELRTPLTVIRSSVDHLRRNARQPVAKVADALDDIDSEVHHLTSMVDDLLLLARSDSGAVTLERVPVELDDVAAEAAGAFEASTRSRDIRLVVDPEPARTMGDPSRLRQLAMILVDNAIRHSRQGGEVRITVRSGADASSDVSLSVEDEGPGIRPDDLAHVFDRFWRSPDAPPGGTGLGLAIARWIAESHHGRIVATNRPQGGARFEVRLPSRPADRSA